MNAEFGADSRQKNRENALNSTNNIKPKLFYDRERLANLAKLAIGRRSLKDFAAISGLSEGFLSRLTTGKLQSPPTKRSLSKLISEDSAPQNNITLGDVMAAAGYISSVEIIEEKKNIEASDFVFTAAFPPYLITMNLEKSGQLAEDYKIRVQKGLFFITPLRFGKEIVGVSAFYGDDFSPDEAIIEIQRSLFYVLTMIPEKERRLKFFVIITNKEAIYNNFDKGKIPFLSEEFCIILTEDYVKISRQRAVSTINPDGTINKFSNVGFSYDFTKTSL